jgi:hypothetical protein
VRFSSCSILQEWCLLWVPIESEQSCESIQGFFFSSEVVQLLAEMGVGLDIDVVPHVSCGQKY